MIMAHLRRIGWHSLKNDAQILAFDQMPTVAIVAPHVMLGIVLAHF